MGLRDDLPVADDTAIQEKERFLSCKDEARTKMKPFYIFHTGRKHLNCVAGLIQNIKQIATKMHI